MMKLNLIICQLIVRVEGKISYSRLYNGFSRPTSTVDHISGYLKKGKDYRLCDSYISVLAV